MAFVKLDCDMLNSTIWFDRDARDVFITALLMAIPYELAEPQPQLCADSLDPTDWLVPVGWYGFVRAAGPGIVGRSGVDRASGMAALVRMGQPELESKSKDFEGRRLVRVDGGYLVLNFFKYRDRDHTAAERMRRLRLRRKPKLETESYTDEGEEENDIVTENMPGVRRNTVTVTANNEPKRRHVTHAEVRGQRTEARGQRNSKNASLRSALNNSQPRASSDQTETLQKEVSQNKPAGRTIFGGGLDSPAKRDPSTFGSGGSNGASAGQGPRGPMSRSQEAPGAVAAVSAPTDSSEEPESPQEAEGAGSAPENDSPAERLSRAAATVVAVQTRVVLDKLRKNRTAQLKSDAVDARPAEKKPRVTKGKIPQDVMLKVRVLEKRWADLMKGAFPDIVTASWGGKECSQAAQLLGKYGFDVTGLSFDYVVMNWETIGSRSFKGIGGVPSVGFLLSRHEVLVAEAQQWTKIRDFQVEHRAWRQANRLAMVLPQPLETQRRALQSAAKTLGIVL